MESSSEAKLSVLDLQAQYFMDDGVIKAVDNISFTINENESLGIAGESACGKSSLGAAILRIMQPPGKIIGGNIILNGNDIAKLSDTDFNKRIRWKKISMVFQGAMNSLDPVYTIGYQLKEILEQHNFKGLIDDKISESLEQVGLDRSVSKKYPHELSGGMKQRVVIAMALLLEPDVVIADEIGIMYAGQIVEFGSANEIYKDPKHPYTQALISAIPKLRSDNKEIHFIKGNPPDMLNLPSGCRFYARCPHAMDICKEDPPTVKTKTGYTLCWLYK